MTKLGACAGVAAPDQREFTTFGEFQQIFQAVFQATQTRPDNLLRLRT